jgi:hypothetical protein
VRQRPTPVSKEPESDRSRERTEQDIGERTPSSLDQNLVIIPPDYEERRVVPILIRPIDDLGHRVYRGWIDAVRPVAGQLRRLARNIVGDAGMVSEIAERSVHGLSARYGKQLGTSPSGKIFENARWLARDIAGGGWRRRKGYETRLTEVVVDTLVDDSDFAKAYENRDFIEKLVERLETLGLTDVAAQVHLYLSESEQLTIFQAPRGSQALNTRSHRFFYNLRKVVKLLEPKARGR